MALPKLERVYFWGTSVTAEGAKTLASARFDEAEARRIENEIKDLQRRLARQKIQVEMGAPKPETSTNTGPTTLVNATCPLSGKPADPSKKLEIEGKTYAFCCDECLQKAQKDPKIVLAAGKK
jgi:YHS domain-containing protein